MDIRRIAAGLAGLGTALAVAAPASAAPATVNLRVEGAGATVFEGVVTTDVRPFRFTGSATTFTCDGTAATGGTSATPQPTRIAALLEASDRSPFTVAGQWFTGLGPSFTTIGAENVAYDPATNRYLVEYENWAVAQLGGCADPIATGDEVLYAYGTGTEPLLKLTAPEQARPGAAFEATVTDGATGAPVVGATVGGATTSADGKARVTLSERGLRALKAEKPGTVRSNRAQVCVSDGSDGACGTATAPAGGTATCVTAGDDGLCGTRDRRAPAASIAAITLGRVFARGRGPRELAGTVASDPSGIKVVKLRLTRRAAGRCAFYSSRLERFRRVRCNADVPFFSIGSQASWSYLLPERLGRGRYVLEVVAIDNAFNRDRVQTPRNRVVFRVR
jgi:hypothetical protein